MKVEEVWFHGPDQFENHHGGVVLLGDYLYGGDGQNNGTPVCLEFLTGKVMWKADSPGKGIGGRPVCRRKPDFPRMRTELLP